MNRIYWGTINLTSIGNPNFDPSVTNPVSTSVITNLTSALNVSGGINSLGNLILGTNDILTVRNITSTGLITTTNNITTTGTGSISSASNISAVGNVGIGTVASTIDGRCLIINTSVSSAENELAIIASSGTGSASISLNNGSALTSFIGVGGTSFSGYYQSNLFIQLNQYKEQKHFFGIKFKQIIIKIIEVYNKLISKKK
jgi:hypothetical protein